MPKIMIPNMSFNFDFIFFIKSIYYINLVVCEHFVQLIRINKVAEAERWQFVKNPSREFFRLFGQTV